MITDSGTPKPNPDEDWPGRQICHQEYSAKLAERRAELGNPELPRKSGARRTASKRALLAVATQAEGFRCPPGRQQDSYFQFRFLPCAIISTASAMRLARVSGRLAAITHSRYSRRQLGGKP